MPILQGFQRLNSKGRGVSVKRKTIKRETIQLQKDIRYWTDYWTD